MNTPYLLGTVLTHDRERAKLYGAGIHFLNGWVFSLIYVSAFHAWGRATWWLGAAIGLVHATFVLVAGMPLFPALHPRMASEHEGPEGVRVLEPPGFFGLHYGVRTPVSIVLAHLVYGGVLGAFYTLG